MDTGHSQDAPPATQTESCGASGVPPRRTVVGCADAGSDENTPPLPWWKLILAKFLMLLLDAEAPIEQSTEQSDQFD